MIILEHENQIDKQLTFLIPGNAARLLPEEVKLECADKVSHALTEHPYTMLQFAPFQIVKAMERGWTVIALEKGFKVVGFAQFWQYGFNEDGQQILEFGSWLSFRSGVGEKILMEAIRLGKKINPKAQLVAIVEEENLRAREILQKVGAEEIGNKFSPVIRTVEGEAAFMKIYDITNNGGIYDKS